MYTHPVLVGVGVGVGGGVYPPRHHPDVDARA